MTELELTTEESMSIIQHPSHNNDQGASHAESSNHHKIISHASDGCDGDASCSACPAHCASLMILTESSVLVLRTRVSFTMSHFVSKASGNNFRLLRPPKIN